MWRALETTGSGLVASNALYKGAIPTARIERRGIQLPSVPGAWVPAAGSGALLDGGTTLVGGGRRCSVLAVSQGEARVRWEDSGDGKGAGQDWVDVTRLQSCTQELHATAALHADTK